VEVLKSWVTLYLKVSVLQCYYTIKYWVIMYLLGVAQTNRLLSTSRWLQSKLKKRIDLHTNAVLKRGQHDQKNLWSPLLQILQMHIYTQAPFVYTIYILKIYQLNSCFKLFIIKVRLFWNKVLLHCNMHTAIACTYSTEHSVVQKIAVSACFNRKLLAYISLFLK